MNRSDIKNEIKEIIKTELKELFYCLLLVSVYFAIIVLSTPYVYLFLNE